MSQTAQQDAPNATLAQKERHRRNETIRNYAQRRLRDRRPDEYREFFNIAKLTYASHDCCKAALRMLATRHRDEYKALHALVRDELGWVKRPPSNGWTAGTLRRPVILEKNQNPWFLDVTDVWILYDRWHSLAEIASILHLKTAQVLDVLVPVLLNRMGSQDICERLKCDSAQVWRSQKRLGLLDAPAA